jgi:hypothetical protein
MPSHEGPAHNPVGGWPDEEEAVALPGATVPFCFGELWSDFRAPALPEFWSLKAAKLKSSGSDVFLPLCAAVFSTLGTMGGDPGFFGASATFFGSSGATAALASSPAPWWSADTLSRHLQTKTVPTRHRNEHDTTKPALVSRVIFLLLSDVS